MSGGSDALSLAKYKLIFSQKEISNKVKDIAAKIKRDYEKEKTPITLLAVAVGALFFAIDLLRELNDLGVNYYFDIVRLKSRKNNQQSGKVYLKARPYLKNISDRKIVVVEDLIDDGKSMNFLDDYLRNLNCPPKSIRYCCLLIKKGHDFKGRVHYVGFRNVARKWLRGYGLDDKGLNRGDRNIEVQR
jgi:hypoxanthine phosphoribosyltransferase